jgi:ribosomal protein S18 acetylase RimI-like enzyme
MTVLYQLQPNLSESEFVALLRRSTLARRRPIDEPETIEQMLRGADILLTARLKGQLVGVARSITDHAYCTYLSDLAVDVDYQRQGIGKELIRRTHQAAGLGTTLILLSAPAAVGYYEHLQMDRHEACFTIPRQPITRLEREPKEAP